MKWFKRRAPVVVVRDDALANYFKEERGRKEDEEFLKSLEGMDLGEKKRKREFEEDKASLESSVEWYFFKALAEFKKKWWFVIEKSRSDKEKDLYINLLLLWIVNLKINVWGSVKGIREPWIDLFSHRNILRARINGEGENYTSFWNTKRYDELVSIFKKHMEDNAGKYGQKLYDNYGRDSYEIKLNNEEHREEKIKEMEEGVKKAADDFIENLAQLKRAMDYEDCQRWKRAAKDRLWLIVPVIIGWGLGVLGKCNGTAPWP